MRMTMMEVKMPKLTESGRIREIRGNLAIVVPNKSAACFGCLNQECRSGGGQISAENSLNLPLSAGQVVEVSAPGAAVASQALAVVLPPIIGFAAGFSLVRLAFPVAGEAVAAFAGLALFFGAAIIINKIRKGKPAGFLYSITRIL